MKTILLISRCPPYPLHFGDRLIIWHLTRELSRRGYVIDLLALYDRDDDLEHVDRYRACCRHIELFREPCSRLLSLPAPADRPLGPLRAFSRAQFLSGALARHR